MPLHIFGQFLILGCICFGGPVAHIGYFNKRFVSELQWLSEAQFQRLFALCQCLPGPASSQLGFAVGYHRGGLAGALAAFIGFTLPSFVLMFVLAIASSTWLETSWLQLLIHGLKLLAVIVVADAVVGMSKNFCGDIATRMMALFSFVVLLYFPNAIIQIAVLLIAAIIGSTFLADTKAVSETSALKFKKRWLVLFSALLIALLWSNHYPQNIHVLKEFYLAGSLVFGGGHVVLPLLQNGLSEIIDPQTFLTGYGFAQLIPGPMFTLSSFLGTTAWQGNAFIGALLATLAIFTPGFLLLLAALPAWESLCQRPRFNAAIKMLSAAVVGILAAAWVSPVVTSSIVSFVDGFIVLIGFYLLRWKGFSILKLSLLILLFQIVKFVLQTL
ncbi:chorismate-binding protein [Shewanella sp. OPT22]|nr:chorismate-binding protein [Shewanella sp. OPT22]